MARFLRFDHVSFSFAGMTRPLIDDADVHFAQGWTGIVGPNGAGKTTLLQLATGGLEPVKGQVHHLASGIYAVQRTDNPPEGWEDFDEALDGKSQELRHQLGIKEGWFRRWNTLSHGERKRCQIAVVLWNNPEVLALDEPTNHIDVKARAMLIDALKNYNGVGLLVSHDRELLDSLCSNCLFINPPKAILRPGGVTAGQEQDRREQETARKQDANVKDAAKRLASQAQSLKEQSQTIAAKQKNKKFKALGKNDHDAKEKRHRAEISNKNQVGSASQHATLAQRARDLDATRSNYYIRPEYEMGFWLDDSKTVFRGTVLSFPAGEVPLGDGRKLVHPDLYISPTDRIALTGENGLGKSTILKKFIPCLKIERERLIYIPQEITAEEAKELLADVKTLQNDKKGVVMTSVRRLGSHPGRLLESALPSPGEIRKLLLALGVAKGPHLIVMDEPTNHMDLPSIECLEEALAECPCAMLLVSHDRRFLDKLTDKTWHLELQADGVTVILTPGRRDTPVLDEWNPDE
ncbi:MAG: ATP-binding cassette domain-containing protein [Kiritimatiellaeota bacterium]|nr:ATP-binding cassette domain-containing protein [Kiritimatiellota bacterium]